MGGITQSEALVHPRGRLNVRLRLAQRLPGGSASTSCTMGPEVCGYSDSWVTNNVAPGVSIPLLRAAKSGGIFIRATAAGSTCVPSSPTCPGTPTLNQRYLLESGT